jgi:serine/threonine protein kinase
MPIPNDAGGNHHSHSEAAMASAILKPGTTVGNRYRIDLLLGGGESCPTYRCRDQANGDAPVALKVLADRDGAEGIARLRRELSILSRVKHPHLVHHTDFGVIHRGRTPYLVRPFITGQDIYLSSADWSVELILDQLAEIGRVLQFLHSRGLVFRHLKPANIILTCGATSPITARLLDFGLDRPMRRGRNEPLPHAYAAPEVLLGHLGNSRSDLYSFGILAYQLLGRRLPFDDDDVGYLVQKQLQGRADMRPIERLKGGAGLAQVILCLLEKDPEKRPSSADDMVRLLSAASGRDYSGSVSGATEAYFSSGCFVGREKEMEFLQDRAQRVRETGRGHTVFLAGEGGAGKSRLLEELRTFAR